MTSGQAPAEVLSNRILELANQVNPLLVAIDGRSGVGKSTLAAAVAIRAEAVVIDGDDFYAGGTDEEWDAMTAAEQVQHCIDWRRQRSVLEDLLHGRSALWFPYDWEADNGQLSGVAIRCPPSAVVILDGAYSARPELADLFALRVLVDTPTPVRRQRLLQREGDQYRADWEARWSSAEDHYFGTVLGEDAFDLVIGI